MFLQAVVAGSDPALDNWRFAVDKLAVIVGTTLASAAISATGAIASGPRPLTPPVWARPLSGIRPYVVEPNYGTSRGLTCDLTVYTTNPAALDGKASLRPGDVTATVCAVKRAGR